RRLVRMRRGGNRKVFLALEVMEEAALGDPGGLADVVHGGRGVALGTDQPERGLEQAHAGGMGAVGHGWRVGSGLCRLAGEPLGPNIPTSWYGVKRLLLVCAAQSLDLGQEVARVPRLSSSGSGQIIAAGPTNEKPAMPLSQPETYNDRIVRNFLLAAAVWGIVGMSWGVFAAAQMAWPALNFDIPWLTFSRIRPNHTFGVIFGFGVSALMGT